MRPQIPVIDQDGDGAISEDEFKAGNLSNLMIVNLGLAVITRQEAVYPRQVDILRDAEFKVLFLQGAVGQPDPGVQRESGRN